MLFRKSNELTMKAAIEQLLDTYKLSDQFIVEKIKINWPELVGKVIANRTDEINIRQQKYIFSRYYQYLFKRWA